MNFVEPFGWCPVWSVEIFPSGLFPDCYRGHVLLQSVKILWQTIRYPLLSRKSQIHARKGKLSQNKKKTPFTEYGFLHLNTERF